MGVIFVAGAGTDIGKTYIAAALVRARRAAGRPVMALKPVASGWSELGTPGFATTDTARLLDAQGVVGAPDTIAACTPWRFKAALAPDMAAAAEGRDVRLTDVLQWCRRRLDRAPAGADVLIEGVGGVMSPATRDALNLDWIIALGCPVLLVGGAYLGAISHTLTAVEVLRARGATLTALVVNEAQPSPVGLDATVDALRRFGGVEPIPVRHGQDPPLTAWPVSP